MPTIHFLNVRQGDCSIIEHISGHISMVDVCNAKPIESLQSKLEQFELVMAKSQDAGVQGNFQQKKYPVNPVAYLREHGINSIFRYIQTHPDMDHMDGIATLFGEFSPLNFWDTDNTKEMSDESWSGSPYSQDDWKLYKYLRDTKPDHNPRRLTPLAGHRGQYWNISSDGTAGGDGIRILAPNAKAHRRWESQR